MGDRWRAPLLVGAAFVVLTALVAVGALDGADRMLKDVFRPGMRWTVWQVWAQRTEGSLSPPFVLLVLLVVVPLAVRRRRSWRPAVVAVLGLGTTGALALLVKVVLRRPDPNLAVTGAGSYPSGHTVTLVVGVGLALLVTVGLTRWAWALVALAGTMMGLALVVEGAHWFTDVVGGGLLGGLVLAVLVAVERPVGQAEVPVPRHRATIG